MNPTVSKKNNGDDELSFTLANVNVSIANSIRRIILAEIPTVVFRVFPHVQNKVQITKNTTRLTNEMLKQRMGCIPIHMRPDAPISTLIVEINKKNTTDQMMYVTTGDFKIRDTNGQYLNKQDVQAIFPSNKITHDFILFARLRPGVNIQTDGEELSIEATLDIGTAKEDGMYNVVSKSCYTNTQDIAKIEAAWLIELARLTNEGVHAELIEAARTNWLLIDAPRLYKDNSFDFKIKTNSVYSNEALVGEACTIMLNKLETFNGKVQTKTIKINKSETTVENSYDIVLENEDYTLGKVLEYLLYVEYFDKQHLLTYCGFKQFHPHDDDSIVRISFKNDEDLNNIYDYLINISNTATTIYEAIRSEFETT